MKTRKRFYMKMGNHLASSPDSHIEIIGKGKNMYLWIGEESAYAHISGPKTLECLANSILEALKAKP